MPELSHIAWQPIIALHTDYVLGHEALARFVGLSPLVAFAQQSDTASVMALDRRCIHQAFASPPSDGLLFVNVTAETVHAGYWPRVPPALHDRVIWELPEAGGWDPAMIPPGMPVALDDIGVGFAELLRVAQVPWRYLKVDHSLVHGIAQDKSRQELVHALVAQADGLRRFIIAEGVEDPADAQCLAALGVHYGQGFLWGKPHQLFPSLQARILDHSTTHQSHH